MNPNFNNKENLNTNTVIPVEKTDDWLSMSEAAHHTPYSAEYLSLLARKRKLVSKKIGNAWYTTKSVLNDYMKKQMMRAQLNNSQFPIYSSDLLNESSSDNSDKNVSTILKPLRSYQSDLKIYGPKVKENIIKAVSVSPPKDKIVPLKVDLPRVEKIENSYADLERLLERIINKNFGRRFSPLRTVLSSKLLFTAALIGIVLLALLPVPVVFSFFDKSFDYVKDAINNSNTVLGFRPGTHENEILLLDAEGNIAIMGHIETGGQLKSSVADGIAPIVVDSKTLVKNLNAEFLGGASSTDFTLAFITKNGNVTTDDVKLEGSVEVGKTLIVRGATKLLSALEVGDKLKVFGDAEFTQALDVLGPAYFNSIVTLQEDLIVKGDIEALKNISVRGSVESGSAVIAKSGSFGSLGVTGSFSAGGKITLGDEEETLTVNSKNMTIDAKGNATFDSSVSAPFISATRFEVTNSTTTNAIITNSTTTNAFISSLTGNDLRIGSTATSTINSLGDLLVVGSTTLQNFTFVNATGTSATTTNLFSTTASSTNLFSALLNSGSATFQNLLVNSSSTLQNITFLNSTSTNATTTNFFTGWFTANQLQVGQTATTTINDLGDLFVVGSTTLQNFSFLNATGTQATSTNLFSSTLTGNSLAIGSTATSTINSSGDLLVVGSTTLQNFTFINATGTSATTTNFFSTTASSTNLFFTTANGGNLTSTGLGTFRQFVLLRLGRQRHINLHWQRLYRRTYRIQ
ncbi:MAG: hypothetical protein HYT68_00255 [Candidatus Zambryskibacteria bacterium]|nr:hypothetical protein [Candidatus Zambryskibacteria bacterium]